MKYHSIYPGQVWHDTEGKRIQAHGGSIYYENSTFYWYGEDKTYTDGQNGIWHNGVRAYASKDLYNWEDQGTIIAPSEDIRSSLHPSLSQAAWNLRKEERRKKATTPSESVIL